MILALGMMSGGVYNDAFANNLNEREIANNQQRQERVLTEEDTVSFIVEMTTHGSTELVIADGYTSIADNAFFQYEGLMSITIPNSVISIDSGAFYGCTGLTSVTIPGSVISIDDEVFEGCENATFVILNIEVMKKHLLSYHNIAENRITIDNSASKANEWAWKTDGNIEIPGYIKSIGRRMFADRKDIKSITIPNSVTSIGYGAFNGRKGLTSVTIPGRVTSIGDLAFCGCKNAKFVIPNIEGMKQYLQSCHNIAEDRITIDNNASKANEWAWKTDGSIVIPNDIESIGDCMFKNRKDIKSITINNNVTSIGEYAFHGCEGLTSITIPKGVISVGKLAFYECERLTYITIPNSVQSIGWCAFYDCDKLEKVYVYSDRVKGLVINSGSAINPNIIEITEKHENERK